MCSTIERQTNGTVDAVTLLGSLQQLLKTVPDKTWALLPVSSDLQQGWRHVTYTELSHAVNGQAIWIERHVKINRPGEVIAYMGMNDARYIITVLAAMKLGLKILLPSPRNPIDGQINLFNVTECTNLLYSELFDVDSVKHAMPNLQTRRIMTLESLIQLGRDHGAMPAQASSSEDEVVMVLHTSGSTGLPKPIFLTNGFFAAIQELRQMQPPAGRSNMHDPLLYNEDYMITIMPLFHMAAWAAVSRSLFHPAPLVLTPGGRPISSDLVIEMINQTKPYSAMLTPSVLEEMSRTDQGMDALAQLKFCVFTGAPLAHEAGERIQRQTRLSILIGATEAGVLPVMVTTDPSDWSYYEWSVGSGIEMVQESDDLYECVVQRDPGRKYQGIFHTFPDLTEWHTKDLYAPHPTKPGLWDYRGRKDDVIVLSNGEKVLPVTFEKVVEDDLFVHGALVVGQGHFQTALVVEPIWDKLENDISPQDIVERIWPTIDKANQGLPAYGHVWRSKIAIAHRNRPFVRAPKGSIMRRATTNLYKREIEALYTNEDFNGELGKLGDDIDATTVLDFVRKAIAAVNSNYPKNVSDDTDFFTAGMDSLQVLGVASALAHACEGSAHCALVNPKDIYTNSTVHALADFIIQSQGKVHAPIHPNREELMKNMLEKYTHDLPERVSPKVATSHASEVVVLTGSTGGLGNYVLQESLSSPKISKIYCLNRSPNAEDRQRQSFHSRDLIADFTKVTFLQTDFSLPQFGLSDSNYLLLLSNTTTVIHNAWAVDFNKTLSSYEQTHIAGTRHIVDFCLSSPLNPKITFISSIATVENWAALHPTLPSVPEQLFDSDTTISQGYSESKWVAEHILHHAATRSKFSSTIIRSNQLAGPTTTTGIWNRNEWLPSLIATSKSMGLVPQTLGTQTDINWVPLDTAAQIILDLVIARSSDPEDRVFEVFHLTNPRTAPWSSLIPVLREHFDAKVVSYSEWVSALSRVPVTREEAGSKPAVKLLDFYRGLGGSPRLDTSKAEQRSRCMQGLRAVDAELMRNWMRQWGT